MHLLDLFPDFALLSPAKKSAAYDLWRMRYRRKFVFMAYDVKDSGERQQFDSGMQRDVTTGKPRFDLCFDGPMMTRYAEHLRKGAEKYEPRNWMKASGVAEMERFRESAARHFAQWMAGDTDEDHAAAVMFNLNGFEFVKERMSEHTS
jgi:hypothetical protein